MMADNGSLLSIAIAIAIGIGIGIGASLLICYMPTFSL